MKRGVILVVLMLFIISLTPVVYAAWTLQVEDGITANCGQSGGTCSYWIDYDLGVSTQRECLYDEGVCKFANGGYFTMNTSGASVPPNSKCSVSVNITGLTSTANENLTVTINGLSQEMPDQGDSGTAYYTFPEKFNFTQGKGQDIINFSGPGNTVQVDYFVISDCESLNPQAPEFSGAGVVLSGLAGLILVTIYKKRKVLSKS